MRNPVRLVIERVHPIVFGIFGSAFCGLVGLAAATYFKGSRLENSAVGVILGFIVWYKTSKEVNKSR